MASAVTGLAVAMAAVAVAVTTKTFKATAMVGVTDNNQPKTEWEQ